MYIVIRGRVDRAIEYWEWLLTTHNTNQWRSDEMRAICQHCPKYTGLKHRYVNNPDCKRCFHLENWAMRASLEWNSPPDAPQDYDEEKK